MKSQAARSATVWTAGRARGRGCRDRSSRPRRSSTLGFGCSRRRRTTRRERPAGRRCPGRHGGREGALASRDEELIGIVGRTAGIGEARWWISSHPATVAADPSSDVSSATAVERPATSTPPRPSAARSSAAPACERWPGPPPLAQQAGDHLAADVAGATGDEDGAHRRTSVRRGSISRTWWAASCSASTSRTPGRPTGPPSSPGTRGGRGGWRSRTRRGRHGGATGRVGRPPGRGRGRGWPGRCACRRFRPPWPAGRRGPGGCRRPRPGSGGVRSTRRGRSGRSGPPARSSGGSLR